MSRRAEPTLEELERKIPAQAKAAVRKAYREALESGKPVIVSKGGALRAVRQDGTSKVLKKIEPRISVKKGTKILIP